FSAMSASCCPFALFQQITRCHWVFSCVSPRASFHCRDVASDSVATRRPLVPAVRTSGSLPRLPIRVTLLSDLLMAAVLVVVVVGGHGRQRLNGGLDQNAHGRGRSRRAAPLEQRGRLLWRPAIIVRDLLQLLVLRGRRRGRRRLCGREPVEQRL